MVAGRRGAPWLQRGGGAGRWARRPGVGCLPALRVTWGCQGLDAGRWCGCPRCPVSSRRPWVLQTRWFWRSSPFAFLNERSPKRFRVVREGAGCPSGFILGGSAGGTRIASESLVLVGPVPAGVKAGVQ